MHVDTSFLVALLREERAQTPGPAHDLMSQLEPHTPLIASVFVWCELEVGVRLSRSGNRAQKALRILQAGMQTRFPDHRFPEHYAAVYAALEKTGERIGVMDSAIAAMALVDQQALITGNRRHFDRVPGLEVVSFP